MMKKMDNAIIIAVLSLFGTIATAISGYFLVKRQSKASEMEASSSLINAALSINKQELETTRVLNTILLEDYRIMKEQYQALLTQQKDLSEKYTALYESYNECIENLEQADINTPKQNN